MKLKAALRMKLGTRSICNADNPRNLEGVTTPSGIGRRAHDVPCAGNPNRPGAVLNDCGQPARWVVVAPQIIHEGRGPVVCIIGACHAHVLPVKEWMRDRAMDAAALLGEPFTEDDEPLVEGVGAVEQLRQHFGDMAWIAARAG